jgi:hypothetical protein
MRRAIALSAISLLGCLSHIPPVGEAHMKVHWVAGFDAAVRQASASGRPILAIFAAGALDGLC